MEIPANPVATIISHHRETGLLDVGLDPVPDITEARAGLTALQADFQCPLRRVEKSRRLGRNIADGKGHIHVTMIAGIFHRDIDGDDVAGHQLPAAGNAMDDLFIDRSTDTARIPPVVERTGHGALAADVYVGGLIQSGRGDARSDHPGDTRHGIGGNAATGTDLFDLVGGLQVHDSGLEQRESGIRSITAVEMSVKRRFLTAAAA